VSSPDRAAADRPSPDPATASDATASDATASDHTSVSDTFVPDPPVTAPPTSMPPQGPAYPMALEPPDPNVAVGAGQPAGAPAPGDPPAAGDVAGAATSDAGTSDAGMSDAGMSDAGTSDAGAAGPVSRRPRSVALALVSVVAAVGLVASGVFGYLWWDRQRTLDDTRAQLTAEMADLRETADQREGEIDRLLRELQGAADETAAVVQALEGAQNMVELLRDEQGVIRRCLALNAEMIDAIVTNNQAAFEAVVDEAEEVCGQASEILGS
jgi:hypothetical protein